MYGSGLIRIIKTARADYFLEFLTKMIIFSMGMKFEGAPTPTSACNYSIFLNTTLYCTCTYRSKIATACFTGGENSDLFFTTSISG